jgi:hypothetical protein
VPEKCWRWREKGREEQREDEPYKEIDQVNAFVR